MNMFSQDFIKAEAASAMNFHFVTKALKLILAVIVCVAYFMGSSWLIDVIVVSVVVSLILPMGFFDTFIQKHHEYNTLVTDERMLLNANESNKHFEKIFQEIKSLKSSNKKKRDATL